MATVSSVNRHRISTYHVNRKTNNLDVSKVDQLERVNPVKNSTAAANDNFAMFSEAFYGKLRDLKQFYQRFYLSEQALEDIINKFKQGPSDAFPADLKELILELVEQYNRTYQSLAVFEKEIGLNHSRMLIKTLHKYEVRLHRLGIRVMSTGLLQVDSVILERNLEYHPEYLHVLFQVEAGLLHELNQHFKWIQAHPNHSQFLKVKDHITEVFSRGSLLDEKS